VGILAGIVAGCSDTPGDLEVIHGTRATAQLTAELARLGVHLPQDPSKLDWLMVNTWDTNETYLRVTASRDSVHTLLKESQIDSQSLRPLAGVADSSWILPLPRYANWALTAGESRTALGYVDLGAGRATPVGVAIVAPDSARPTVILHWFR
jgi:hypothetical protein